MDSAERRERYAKVSTALAHLDDEALRGLLPARPRGEGWGTTHAVEVAGEPVFVKIVPLTDLERERPYSTKNHYRLPNYYQYGVGSGGFGAWRELVTHVTTTNWVLAGEIDTFPLMYHFRVVRRPSLRDPVASMGIDEYVRYWNSSKNVGRYIGERGAGSHAALVFLELLPHSIWDWLSARPDDTERLIRQLCDTVSFLREHGVVHFDAHFNNAMTDGERVYLGDYGLTLDTRFDLTGRERAFLERHPHYDLGGIICSIGFQLARSYDSLPEAERALVRERLGVPEDPSLLHPALVRGVEKLADVVHPALVEAVVRYRDIVEFMGDFFASLSANRRKNTAYDDDRLRQLLRKAGVKVPARRTSR